MTLNDPDQTDVPSSFAEFVLWGAENVPRPSRDARQTREVAPTDHSESPTHWEIAAIKAEARAEGYVAGRVDGITAASEAIISELDSNVEQSKVVGTEARAYKAGLTISKSIVDRIGKRLILSAKAKR
jgi:hypothetical protein